MDTALLQAQTPTHTQPLFKKRGAKNIRKRPATPPPADSDSESGYTSTEGEGRAVKRRKKTAIVTASSNTPSNTTSKALTEDLSATQFAADRSARISETNDATKTANWFDEPAPDAKSLLGTTRSRPVKTDKDTEPSNDGTYKGAAGYQSFIQKNPNAPSRIVGPIKAPTNIRTITVTDFAPDVCKDYKQTGFCGFGDSCKYLHLRENYKQGWELDKDWEKVGDKGRKSGVAIKSLAEAEDSEEEDAALEGIPFACIICKKPYTNPIVTKCGHYFCEACALQKYRKNPSCTACGAGTGGVFNGAKNLRKILDRKRERAKRRREKAKEAGEEVSEEDAEGGQEDG
ncbi:MAG: RNA-splicing factor [Alectoria sarmentosa]|nr:MAG: RNA-splicing factor [Alectoria sarmentosa]